MIDANERLGRIHQRLLPLRTALLEHPIYDEIDRLSKLHIFMQHHVFAVWDFMSLLKKLQQSLCGDTVPWMPPRDTSAARFVNEIVLGEETDEDGEGGFSSHFHLYHRAMQRCGADTGMVDVFLERLRQGDSIAGALDQSNTPSSVRTFVLQTFEVINQGELCAVAAAFAFGREDLLPDVFQRIVDQLNQKSNGDLDSFEFYLRRHIELDGDQHGPMAERMIAGLCGNEEKNWRLAEDTAVQSLQARTQLWDGMVESIRAANKAAVTE